MEAVVGIDEDESCLYVPERRGGGGAGLELLDGED